MVVDATKDKVTMRSAQPYYYERFGLTPDAFEGKWVQK